MIPCRSFKLAFLTVQWYLLFLCILTASFLHLFTNIYDIFTLCSKIFKRSLVWNQKNILLIFFLKLYTIVEHWREKKWKEFCNGMAQSFSDSLNIPTHSDPGFLDKFLCMWVKRCMFSGLGIYWTYSMC
jgi:hypothetical protein